MSCAGCFGKAIVYGIGFILLFGALNSIAPAIINSEIFWLVVAGIVILWLLSQAVKYLTRGANGPDNGTIDSDGFFWTGDGIFTNARAKGHYMQNMKYRRESEAEDALFGSLRDRAHRK